MKALGFEHRQIRNITANKGTRYEGKIVGDSPEMCRALDSHGFADLKAAIMACSSYTSVLPIGDARRFKGLRCSPHQQARCRGSPSTSALW